jgi:hypothetical protein
MNPTFSRAGSYPSIQAIALHNYIDRLTLANDRYSTRRPKD